MNVTAPFGTVYARRDRGKVGHNREGTTRSWIPLEPVPSRDDPGDRVSVDEFAVGRRGEDGSFAANGDRGPTRIAMLGSWPLGAGRLRRLGVR
jgi:hypothetical protein